MFTLFCRFNGISIDQIVNIKKRSAQVGLMKSIYQRAGEVIIWLGETQSCAINSLEKIYSTAEAELEMEDLSPW